MAPASPGGNDSAEDELVGIMGIAGEMIESLGFDLQEHVLDRLQERAFEWKRLFAFIGMPPDIVEGQIQQAFDTILDPWDAPEAKEVQQKLIHAAAVCYSGHHREFTSPPGA